jgi:hypothetical protein
LWVHVTSLAILFPQCYVTFMFQFFKFYLSVLSEHSLSVSFLALLPATVLKNWIGLGLLKAGLACVRDYGLHQSEVHTGFRYIWEDVAYVLGGLVQLNLFFWTPSQPMNIQCSSIWLSLATSTTNT